MIGPAPAADEWRLQRGDAGRGPVQTRKKPDRVSVRDSRSGFCALSGFPATGTTPARSGQSRRPPDGCATERWGPSPAKPPQADGNDAPCAPPAFNATASRWRRRGLRAFGAESRRRRRPHRRRGTSAPEARRPRRRLSVRNSARRRTARPWTVTTSACAFMHDARPRPARFQCLRKPMAPPWPAGLRAEPRRRHRPHRRRGTSAPGPAGRVGACQSATALGEERQDLGPVTTSACAFMHEADRAPPASMPPQADGAGVACGPSGRNQGGGAGFIGAGGHPPRRPAGRVGACQSATALRA